MANIRKKYSPQEKAKIALEAIKGELTVSQLTAKYGVHNTQILNWKKQALDRLSSAFSGKQESQQADQNALTDELYKQIGQLKVELDWLKKKSELFSR